MTVFSFVLIALVIYIIRTRKKLKHIYLEILCLDIFVSGAINAGYFLKISQFEIDFGYFLDIVLFILSLTMLRNNRFKRKAFCNYTSLICVALLSMILAIVFPYKDVVLVGTSSWDTYLSTGIGMDYISIGVNNWICFFKLLIFSFNVFCFYSIAEKDDLKKILNKECLYFKILVVICITEFVLKNVFHSNLYDDFKSILLGVGRNTYTQLTSRGESYMLTGLNKEGSALVYVMFFAQILFLINSKSNKKLRIYFITSIALSIVSMSFTTFLYLGELILLYYIYNKNFDKKTKQFRIFKICLTIFILFFTGILIVSFLLNSNILPNYYRIRLEDAVKTLTFISNSNWQLLNAFHSTQYRMISIFETLKLTFNRPLLGFGINTLAVYSSTLKLISSIGYVGTYLWVKHVYALNKKDKIKSLLVALWLLFNLFGGFGITEMFSTFNILIVVLFTFVSAHINSNVERSSNYINNN